MRRAAAGCVLLLMALPAFAASPVSFGVHAVGASINVGEPFTDIYNTGFGGGAHLDVNLLVFSFRLSGDYISFSPDNAKYQRLLTGLIPASSATDFVIDGGRISILSFAVNGKMGLGLPILSPYATGGVGTASISTSDASVRYQGNPLGSVPGVSAETRFSANLGAGLDVNLGVVTLFAEARYTWIFTSDETSTYIPVYLGITF